MVRPVRVRVRVRERIVLVGVLGLGACSDDGGASSGTESDSDGTGSSSTLSSSGGTGPTNSTGVDDGTGPTSIGTGGSSTGLEPGPDCVVYVNGADGDDASGGFSWGGAKRSVPAALDLASDFDCSIWIAQGQYLPTNDDDATRSFVLFEGAELYGGFAGGESELEERDWAQNPVVLSGDIGAAGVLDDNAFHVVRGADGALLDGLTVSDGFSRDPLEGISGAGLLLEEGSMAVRHCIFAGNRTADAPPPRFGTIGNAAGDGAAIYFAGGDLTVEDCVFSGNRTGSGSEGSAIGGTGGRGAGIYFSGDGLSVVDSMFIDQLTGPSGVGGDVGGFGGDGAGVLFAGVELAVRSTIFIGNTTGPGDTAGDVAGSGGSGAAISAVSGTIEIDDCSFNANETGRGGDASPAGGANQIGGGGGLGGALFVVGHAGLTVASSRFEDNVTGTGGAGDLDGGPGLGGAIFIGGSDGDVLLGHNVFIGNRTGLGTSELGSGGGAITVMPSAPDMPQGGTLIVGSVFADNEADIGGAVWIRTKAVAATDIVNSSFAANTANSAGAIWYQVIDPEGAVDATLTNAILWGDSAGLGPEILTSPGFAGDPVLPLIVSSSIVEGGCDPAPPALTCDSGILTTDPLYGDAAAGDLHPFAAGVVDAGDDSALPADVLDLDDDADVNEPWSRDLDSNPRVSGTAVDLGAFES